ncbi:NAD(P)H-dependent oxidoreductase subunit E [Candidatus Acetothermia bacterium]|nr:NAD(P)H-dependent oxidoreductase subunit E [Candidatus Acetothermia bacterium]MCI2427025.1 NAD(P)H-dependent oxidoreductase subunit E [Candidatus Acetothermia bacterium]MCI2428132.1 NAD(P)H-dependent oxidoreductase subunit E [Candidatus Acetothermia bacterium]
MENSPCQCMEESYQELVKFINQYEGESESLIMVLHKIQETLGFVPVDLQVKVADVLRVPISKVFGVISFYAFFTLKPKGKYHISVCKGTACFVRGASKVLDAIEKKIGLVPGDTTNDGKYSLEIVYCLGACGLSPVMTINKEVHARLTPQRIPEILAEYT